MKSHYQFSSVQYLNTDLKSIWEFASSPENLKKSLLNTCYLISLQKLKTKYIQE